MSPLIPLPLRLETGTGGRFQCDGALRVVCEPSLRPLAERFLADVERDTGLVPRGGLSDTVQAGADEGQHGREVHLELRPWDRELAGLPATEGVSPSGRDPSSERYGLEVTADHVRVWALGEEGLFRGLTSVRQLVAASGPLLAPVRVLDAPRFAWRGLALDVARTFLPLADVMRIVDLVSLYKLNVLHLHLTDDAGWRLEIPGRPALTDVGAQGALGGRPGGYYSVDEFARLVTYAAERFVTVVPEIDVPGHATALVRSYPELSASGTAPEPVVGPGFYTSVVDLDVDGTEEVLGDVVREVAAMTPGPFLHIGGDEAFGVEDAAFVRFVDHLTGVVHCAGKRVVGWQETARAGVGPDEVVQYWYDRADEHAGVDPDTGPEGLSVAPELLVGLSEKHANAARDAVRAADKGAAVLMSPSRHAYLDVPYAEPSADPAQEERRHRVGLPSYAPATVREVLDWDPADLLAQLAEHARIAGVEAALWSETVEDADDAQFLLLPRLPGVAERAWSPAGPAEWEEYRERLAGHAPLWDRRGWAYFRSSLVDWPARPLP